MQACIGLWIQYEGPWYDALLLGTRSLVDDWWDSPKLGEICSWDIEEILDDRLQSHAYTDGDESEETEWDLFQFKWDWSTSLQTTDWIINVYG